MTDAKTEPIVEPDETVSSQPDSKHTNRQLNSPRGKKNVDFDLDDIIGLIGDPSDMEFKTACDPNGPAPLSVEHCKAWKMYKNRRAESRAAYHLKVRGEPRVRKEKQLIPEREIKRVQQRERYQKGGDEWREKQREYRKIHRSKLRQLYGECKKYVEEHGVPMVLQQ